MKDYARIAVAILLLAQGSAEAVDVFQGPGVMECSRGICDFSRRPGLGGCSDPCHTTHRNHMNMYDWAFEDVADMSGTFNLRGANGKDGNVCFHRHAENIDLYYPDQYVTIEEGCTARCTGCTFARTKEIVGPALLQCNDGRCTQYTTNQNFDCGDAIENASEAWGSFHTAVGGDNKVHNLHGYEGINTGNSKIRIPKGCNLECSGCNFQLLNRPAPQPQPQPSRPVNKFRQFLEHFGGS